MPSAQWVRHAQPREYQLPLKCVSLLETKSSSSGNMRKTMAVAKVMNAVETQIQSNGVVTNPLSYNFRTFLPEPGGAYSVEVFGPVPWTSGENRVVEDPRGERWGHIELARPVEHPLTGGELSQLLVMPPAFRRYRMMTREETQQEARDFRDRFFHETADPSAEIAKLTERGLWNFDERRALNDDEIGELEPRLIEPPLASTYRAIINRTQRLRRLVELHAPSHIADAEQESIQICVRRFFEEVETADLPSAIQSGVRFARSVVVP